MRTTDELLMGRGGIRARRRDVAAIEDVDVGRTRGERR
jgi:hypothetical protein